MTLNFRASYLLFYGNPPNKKHQIQVKFHGENIMAIIDSTIHSLTCNNCKILESVTILDKGSNYGGSHWQSGKNFINFNSQWSNSSGRIEPSLISATCKKCEMPVSLKSSLAGDNQL